MLDDEPMRQQLNAGEHLLWSGRPRQGIRATFEEQAAGLLVVIVFLVFWLSALVILTLRNLRDVEGQFDPGALFVGLGMFMVGGTMLAWTLGYEAVDRAHTFYGLTDQRILLITGVRRPSVWSCPLPQLQRMDVLVPEDGRGTITFADVSYTRWGNPVVPTFEKIDNVQMVSDLIHRAKDQAHGQGTNR